VYAVTENRGGPPDWPELAVRAEAEAAGWPLQPQHEASVRRAVESARQRLGGDSVEAHAVRFKPEKWRGVDEFLPVHCMESGRITRGDLFATVADGNAERVMWRLFVASKVWGYGPWGYGPSRLAKIERSTPAARLEVLLADALTEGAAHGPMAAYQRLRGDSPGPVAVKYWGAAFFTKALYAGLRAHEHERPALILDAVLASRVTKLSDMPHLLYRGRSYHWGAYRYGVYLAWMGQTAEQFDVSPELLEYSLFTM
jgi:hypothetical protein